MLFAFFTAFYFFCCFTLLKFIFNNMGPNPTSGIIALILLFVSFISSLVLSQLTINKIKNKYNRNTLFIVVYYFVLFKINRFIFDNLPLSYDTISILYLASLVVIFIASFILAHISVDKIDEKYGQD